MYQILNCLETKNGSAIESNFQQPAIPPLRKTRRQASIVCINYCIYIILFLTLSKN